MERMKTLFPIHFVISRLGVNRLRIRAVAVQCSHLVAVYDVVSSIPRKLHNLSEWRQGDIILRVN